MVEQQPSLRCSFCDKTQDQVYKLTVGKGKMADGSSVAICDECVALCVEIYATDTERPEAEAFWQRILELQDARETGTAL